MNQAIESEARRYSIQELRKATEALSERYRSLSMPDRTYISSDLDVAAYAAYRMPATYAALSQVFTRLSNRMPDWSPQTFLDVGAGTGAGIWAASRRWPSIQQSTMLDQDQRMLDLGQRLASQSDDLGSISTCWEQTALTPDTAYPHSDLTVASYVLIELPGSQLDACVSRLWEATRQVLVVVEPGTPRGFEGLRRVREHLIALGAAIAAPCPHNAPCPMTGDDWCHFSVRLQRSQMHREVKPGTLGYEDEKYSYVVASKLPVQPAAARIIRRPQIRKGMVNLELCAPGGLTSRTVTRRKDRAIYRAARSSSWGDAFPPDS